jgi:WD40 repeat protein
LLQELNHNSTVNVVKWSQCGKLAIGLRNGDVEIWEMKDRKFCCIKKELQFSPDKDMICEFAWSPTGLLAINSLSSTTIWNNNLECIKKIHVISCYNCVPIWISDTELSHSDDHKSMALYDINTDTCRKFCKLRGYWTNSLFIANGIICVSYYGTVLLIIKNNNTAEIFVVVSISEEVRDLIWSPKGNLIVVTSHAVTTYNIPKISLLKLIQFGFVTENTNWSNFLKKEPYDPRLFLFVADFFHDPNLFDYL